MSGQGLRTDRARSLLQPPAFDGQARPCSQEPRAHRCRCRWASGAAATCCAMQWRAGTLPRRSGRRRPSGRRAVSRRFGGPSSCTASAAVHARTDRASAPWSGRVSSAAQAMQWSANPRLDDRVLKGPYMNRPAHWGTRSTCWNSCFAVCARAHFCCPCKAQCQVLVCAGRAFLSWRGWRRRGKARSSPA